MAAHPEQLNKLRQKPTGDLAGLRVLMNLIEDDQRPAPLSRIFPNDVEEEAQALDLTIGKNARPFEISILAEKIKDKDLGSPPRRLADLRPD